MESVNKYATKKRIELIVQFLRYSIAGGIATLADLAVFYFLTGVFAFNHIVSNTLSFILGLFVNYFLSKRWVFGSKTGSSPKDFALFSIIGVIGLILTNILLFIFIDMNVMKRLFRFLGDKSVLLLSKTTTVFIVLLWNFSARRKLLFQTSDL